MYREREIDRYMSVKRNYCSLWIPFGDHPLRLERCREDEHGPCARMKAAVRFEVDCPICLRVCDYTVKKR